jgi:hypothetical protein
LFFFTSPYHLAGFLIWVLTLLARLLIWILARLAALVRVVSHGSISTWWVANIFRRAALVVSKDPKFQETIRQHSSLDFQPHVITANEQNSLHSIQSCMSSP